MEQISGTDFPSFLEEHIFNPLKMNSTSVYSFIPGIDSDMPNRIYGYRYNNGEKIWHDTHFLNGAYGDGGIYSTIEDLRKWDKALYTNALVEQSTLMEGFTETIEVDYPKNQFYGLGWEIHQWDDQTKLVGHGGSHVGFKACMLRDIQNKNTSIFLSNNTFENPRKFVDQLAKLLEK